jgi:hypothetical protein
MTRKRYHFTKAHNRSTRPWFAHHAPASPLDQELLTAEYDRLIAAAEHLVRARDLMRGDRLADGLAALVSD